MGLYQGDKPLSSIGKSPAAYAKDAGYTGTDDNFYTALANMPEHLSNQENPHGTTASQVGADVAGAANEALNSAKAYTDQIVAGVIPGDGSKESPADSDSIFIYDNSDSGKPKKTLISKLVELFNNTFYTKTESDTLLQKKSDADKVVNSNLLDNWYFGNPVDQRGGYVVPKGVTVYESDFTTTAGTTDKYYTLVPPNSVSGGYYFFGFNGKTAYVKPDDAVRGYIGAGYGIDRWILQAVTSCSMLVGDGYITLSAKNNDGLLQKFPADRFINGYTLTVSVLTDTELLSKTITLTESVQAYPYDNSIWNIAAGKVDGKWYVWPLITYEQSTVQSIKVRAVKLELGSQQTLAHQDADGNWVLNEIPDYHSELLSCIQSTADALDVCANKVITTNDRLCNPNLLDNWYFGNPVDQRGGYVVPPGVTYYSLSDSSVAGQTDGYVKIDAISTDGYENAIITISGTRYYVRKGNYVRGYTGAGYGIDRWITDAPGGTILINSGSVTLIKNTGSDFYAWTQKVEKAKVGSDEAVTLSALIDGELYTCTGKIADGLHTDFAKGYIELYDLDLDGWRENHYARIVLLGNSCNPCAMKLELGSQQTLAHQDENGKWQLNEIPDYGEQLRRCQRYFVNFNPYKMPWFAMPPAVTGKVTETEAKAFSAVPLPVAMRAEPVVSYGGTIFLSQAGNVQVTDVQMSSSTFAGNYLQLIYITAGGLTENSLYRVQGAYDASAYIWLSADL